MGYKKKTGQNKMEGWLKEIDRVVSAAAGSHSNHIIFYPKKKALFQASVFMLHLLCSWCERKAVLDAPLQVAASLLPAHSQVKALCKCQGSVSSLEKSAVIALTLT